MRAPDTRVDTSVRWLQAIVSVSVVLRVGAAVFLGNEVTIQPGTADQLSYHALALRVLDGHGFSFETGWWPATPAGEPTAHWSYLYVLFLAAVYGVAGPEPLAARVIQAMAVGVLQPVLAFAIGRRWLGARAGLMAAAVMAGYAYFIYYAGALMTESFFIVALLWSIVAAMRAGEPGEPRPMAWVTLGVALATAILLRQAFLVTVPVVLLWIAWRRLVSAPVTSPARLARAIAPGMATTALLIVVAILPWTIRNYRAFDQFVLLNTNAGFAFFWGNHPVHGRSFVPILPGDGSLYGELIPAEVYGLNEAEMDRALLGRGLSFVADDPVRYAFLSVSRLREFVKFWPSPESGRVSNAARVLSFGLCAPFIVAGLVLLVRDRSLRGAGAHAVLVLGVALVYSLAHVLTWTLVRYRLPVDALLLPLAGLAIHRALDLVAPRVRTVETDALVTG